MTTNATPNPMPDETPAPAPPLNRAQRRALKHQKGIDCKAWGSGRVISHKPVALLDQCRPYNGKGTEVAHIITLEAFHRLRDGTASQQDFDRVARVINMCKVRALSIDEGMANELELAQDAMTACKQRWLQTERWGFTGLQLQHMVRAMDIQEAIVDASSHRQLQQANQAANKVMARQMAGKAGQ